MKKISFLSCGDVVGEVAGAITRRHMAMYVHATLRCICTHVCAQV